MSGLTETNGTMHRMYFLYSLYTDRYKINYTLQRDYIASGFVMMDCKYGRKAVMTFD